MYQLHGFSQSGNTYKVALLLQALQQPWAAVHLPMAEFSAGLTRSDAWREQQNPMGEVPMLDDGGQRYTQSAAILLLLAGRHGPHYLGASEAERHEVLRWLFFDNHKFTSYFATWRFMKSFAATPPEPAVAQWLQGRIDNAFGIVDKHLTGREFMVGTAATIADVSLCGYLFFPADESAIVLEERFPNIARWLQQVRQLPGWKPPYELLPGEPLAPRW
jgi:glutathione S-transferase